MGKDFDEALGCLKVKAVPASELTDEQGIELAEWLSLKGKRVVWQFLNTEREAWWAGALTQKEQQLGLLWVSGGWVGTV